MSDVSLIDIAIDMNHSIGETVEMIRVAQGLGRGASLPLFVGSVLMMLSGVGSGSAEYHELTMPPRSSIDESQNMAFYLGPLVFRLSNRQLVLPFSRSGHPFDASICSHVDLTKYDKSLCADGPKSVFLRIGLTQGYDGQAATSFVSTVTLGYRQGYIFDKGSVDEFASEKPSYEGGRIREPELDTQSYAAVRILQKPMPIGLQLAELPGATIFFIAKGTETPHEISCWKRTNAPELAPDTVCFGRTAFLVKDFANYSDGNYPFTLEYTFAASQIDKAPAIERAIIAATSAIPRASFPWPPSLNP